MAQLQYQEQEDLLLDFNSPAQKGHNFSLRDIQSRKSFDKESCWRKSKFNTPASNPNAFSSTQAQVSTKKSTHAKNCIEKLGKGTTTLAEEMNLLSGVLAFEIGVDSLMNAAREFCFITLPMIRKFLCEFPKYEGEYRFLASLALISYGGSWPTLAGIIGAIEIFGTKTMVEEALEVGRLFFYCDLEVEEDGVSPAHVKEIFRKLGLHTALIVAVLVSESWAEICVTVGFASKCTCLVPVQEFLKKTVSKPVTPGDEFDDSFSDVDTRWVELIASIVSNILSFLLFGCFPRLTTAMYMGYLGVSLMMESLVNFTFFHPLIGNFDIADKSFWMKKSTLYTAWGIVTLMAIWQAVSEYTGFFLFFSWVMFAYPIVKVYNRFVTDADYNETMIKKKD